MSNDYFSNYQSFVSSRSMPSPAETPYETPRERPLPSSRRSSQRSQSRGLSRDKSASPPPLPSSPDSSRQGHVDTAVFGMDPKRFTPTLHASLVSEILNLRRELDTKHRFITDLESNLERSHSENDNLADQLAQSTRKSRLAEQRFKTLEHGTLDAVEDLVRERDDARSATAELKSKLEALGKRGKKQEEDAVQSQQSWESEKQSWENERRQLERRVHVTESRLRSFIEEMGARQTAAEQQDQASDAEREDSAFKDSGFGNDSDAGSVRSYRPLKRHTRNQSSVSFRSIPRSVDSPAIGGVASINLADELRFDEEEEYDLEESDHDDEDLLGDGHISRSASLRSAQSDSKAKKILGLADAPKGKRYTTPTTPRDSAATITAVTPNDRKAKTMSGSQRTGSIPEMAAQLGLQLAGACLKYVDHGVQSSRPPSPAVTPNRRDEVRSSNSSPGVEIEKWQLGAVGPDGATDAGAQDVDPVRAASLAIRQQRNVPLSPPETPIIRTNPVNNDVDKSPTSAIRPSYASSSTQTEVAPSAPITTQTEMDTHASRFSTTVDAIQIPSIAIHPPLSASSSSGPPVLPPGMADASAQTDNTLVSNTSDASMQTEEIRIDRRPVKLPSHLCPGSLGLPQPAGLVTRSTADSPEMKVSQTSTSNRNNEKRPLKAISLPRPVLLASPEDKEGDNSAMSKPDNASTPLTDISALLNSSADWTNPPTSSDEQGRENEQSDVFGTTPGLARYNTRSIFTGPPKTVPEDREISPAHQTSSSSLVKASSSRRGSDVSSNSIRPRSARAQGGISRASRTGTFMHSRTPSDTSMGSSSYGTSSQAGPAQPPPFPVPLRSSSRSRVRSGPSSEASWSPTFRDTYRPGHRRSHLDRNSVRRVHSSSTMNSPVRMSPRRRRRGPQLTPIQSMAFENPPIFSPGESDSLPQEDQPFSPVSEDGRGDQEECAVEDNSQEESLVEAIAATMVGEWMWKYVRRRKSFGVGESTPGDDGMNGVRHKRWVWLSPYERTIMWSTKQPNSGIALLGKNGRKLAIKSVLDVKDDTPMRKSASSEPVFDRSILIMAPERALKFTASSKERHYLWLTALSFLAESGRGPPQVPLAPASKPIEDAPRKQRRPSFPVRYGIRRDSTRPAQVAQPLVPEPLPLLGDGSHNGSPTLGEAEPPSVPRVPGRGHQRKRSNSNPVMSPPTIPTGLRSFSSNAMSPTGNSGLSTTATNASSYSQSVSAASRSDSRRPSVASPDQPNFFEAMGTVRMEAFVDRNYHDGVLYLPAGPSMITTKRNTRRGNSIASSTIEEKKGTGHVLDESGRDPFTGF